MVREIGTRRISESIWVQATPARVFRALTEAKELNRWFLAGSQTEPRKGGRILLRWSMKQRGHENRFVTFRPGREVAYTWKWPQNHGQGEVVRFRLRPSKGGTSVTVVHAGFNSAEKHVPMFTGYVEGWAVYLCNLKCYLERSYDLRVGQPKGSIAQ